MTFIATLIIMDARRKVNRLIMVRIIVFKNEYAEKLAAFSKKENDERLHDLLSTARSPSDREEILICLNENDEILGACKVTFTDVVTAESLDYVYVGKAYRKDENGTLLVVAVFQRAVNRLITRLIAKIDARDEIAFAFMKKLGFTVTEEKDGTKYMSKNLLYMFGAEKH